MAFVPEMTSTGFPLVMYFVCCPHNLGPMVSDNVEQQLESVVHVELLMAMEER